MPKSTPTARARTQAAGRRATDAGEADGEPDLHLGKVLAFMRVLWALDHGLQKRSKRMKARLGVTGPQRLVLRLVGRYPDVSAGRLAEILRLHPSTLTGVLRRLERRRQIERMVDPDDRRRARLRLTAAGRRADMQLAGTVEAAVRRAVRRLDPRAIGAAESVLSVVAEELEREDDL